MKLSRGSELENEKDGIYKRPETFLLGSGRRPVHGPLDVLELKCSVKEQGTGQGKLCFTGTLYCTMVATTISWTLLVLCFSSFIFDLRVKNTKTAMAVKITDPFGNQSVS